MSAKERLEFSERLQQALRNADYTSDSPTQLARQFNIRFNGSSITVHAARKWLVGEAIPTQEKLRALAQWLNVSAEWLRFGTDSAKPTGEKVEDGATRIASRDLALLESFHQLDDEYRHIAQAVIQMLIHANQRK